MEPAQRPHREPARVIHEHNMNERMLRVRYAVRGPLLRRADQLQQQLDQGERREFTRVVRANVGDCHALGQQPVTFARQVLALVACPSLLDAEPPLAPPDVRDHARDLLQDCTRGSVGAYSPSGGLSLVREHVAQYLERRDGAPASPECVYLGSGATDLIKAVLAIVAQPVAGKPPAVMIPIPQYPVFSGALAELGVECAPYYLDEERGWALDTAELERSLAEADRRCAVRAIVVINPGNPTGQVLSRENVEAVVEFAHRRGLLLIADEVYQENLISKPFHSFKKVTHGMGPPYRSMELASFFTCSKGWAAECGLRGGFVELLGLAPPVRRAFEETRALAQCPGVLGQCLVSCAVRPPRPGQASYERFERERGRLTRVLAERATAAHRALNAIPGYSCNTIEGSMFAFPRVALPARACEEARELGLQPDEFYCLRLLEETGVCVVPGSGFGQRPGTHHFRTTILHSAEELDHMLHSFGRFQRAFLAHYA